MATVSHEHQRIVVGFDGSEGSRRALEWAVAEATLRGAPLTVVRAWSPGEFGTLEEQGLIAQNRLDEEVTIALKDTDGIPWQTIAARGSAGKVLLEHCADAQMLVVGSRGHGGFAGLLLGSVSQHVSTHPGAPVIVVVRDQ